MKIEAAIRLQAWAGAEDGEHPPISRATCIKKIDSALAGDKQVGFSAGPVNNLYVSIDGAYGRITFHLQHTPPELSKVLGPNFNFVRDTRNGKQAVADFLLWGTSQVSKYADNKVFKKNPVLLEQLKTALQL